MPRILQQAIYVPEPVVLEVGRLLASKKYAWIVKQLDGLFSSGEYIRLVVGITDPSMAEYAFLTHPKSVKPFGDGEVAAIFLYLSKIRLLETSVLQGLEPHEGKLESPCEEPLSLTPYLHLKYSHGIIAENKNCDDVVSFAKDYQAVHFNLDYINADGNISNYYPDFFVKTASGVIYIVETKGLEDMDVPLKMERLKQWCKDIQVAHGYKKFDFVYVDQESYER
ncbi:MAG: hypothetical protein ACOYD6_06045 [Limnochordia bacterium]